MAFSIDGKTWQDYQSSTLSGESYGGTPKGAPLYDYSFGQVRDAAQALGIRNINRQSEVEAVLNRIRNPVAAQAAAPTPAPTPAPTQTPTYTPTTLPVNDPYTAATTAPAETPTPTTTPTPSSAPAQPSFSDQLAEISNMLAAERSGFQQQIADMQAANEERMNQMMNQMQTYQQQAAQSQRELMIGLQARDRNPADVRMARSRGQRRGLSGTGTTGYFGRGDMRINSLNVPTTNLSIAASNPAAGSFA
jgi:hypothetical protein